MGIGIVFHGINTIIPLEPAIVNGFKFDRQISLYYYSCHIPPLLALTFNAGVVLNHRIKNIYFLPKLLKMPSVLLICY